MKRKLKLRKLITVSILSMLGLVLFWVAFSLFRINYYLNQYGYGSEVLPKVAAVYFHLSEGSTIVDVNENSLSTFAARNPREIFERNGYYEAERWGTFAMYNKSGNYEDSGDFFVNDTDDWCFWFRMYCIDNGKRIEDFL